MTYAALADGLELRVRTLARRSAAVEDFVTRDEEAALWAGFGDCACGVEAADVKWAGDVVVVF